MTRHPARYSDPILPVLVETLEGLGLALDVVVHVRTRRQRRGQNGAVRVEHESVLRFGKIGGD